jgi:hypothetical protein
MAKIIICDKTGNVNDTPHLVVDNGHAYNGEVALTTITFTLPDTEPPWGAWIYAAGQSFRIIVPVDSTPLQGPTINYPLVEQLHVESDTFVTASGASWLWRGHIDFMRFRRSLDGQPIDGLKQMYNVGSRVVATLMAAEYIERFHPQDYGDRFYAHIRPFARGLAELGFYWMPILFADAQAVMPDKGTQLGHFARMIAEMNGEPNIMPSLANEYQKNGCDPSIFAKPATNLLLSRGSSTSDAAPFLPGWDFKEWHPRRDWPKVLFGNDDAWYVKEGIDAEFHHLDNRMPCIVSEPIGFWSQDVPGRRSSDPNLARVVGGTSIYFSRGGNFMSENGLRSDAWDARTEECAVSFFNAINQK